MIETNRLLLRPFVTQDAADLLEYLREPWSTALPV